MKKKSLYQAEIVGTGCYLPEKVLTNAELEKTLILRMSGFGRAPVLRREGLPKKMNRPPPWEHMRPKML
jgi:hypothetical protein